MGLKDIDTKNLTITGAHMSEDESHVEVMDDVLIVVTQAFGPDGDNLVGISDVTFDGFPAVTLLVKAGEREGLVHLSPFHGDRRKEGFTDITKGTKCQLFCPVSKKPLDHLGKVLDSRADYYAVYLSERLSKGEVVALSDIWGDYHSRIVDNSELISTWAVEEALSAEMAALTRP